MQELTKKQKSSKGWYVKNRDKSLQRNKNYRTRNKNILSKKRKQQRLSNPEHTLIITAKSRAKTKGLEFTIDERNIFIPSICPVLDIPIKVSDDKISSNSPTLDRIHNNLGYVDDNIIVISARANRIKSNATLNEIFLVYNYVKNGKQISVDDDFICDEDNQYSKHYRLKMLHHTKERAVKNNLEFKLNKCDIIIPKICPVLNIPLIKGSKIFASSSPSVDRIDSTRGYVKENIQIISFKANCIKYDATAEELYKVYQYMFKYSECLI